MFDICINIIPLAFIIIIQLLVTFSFPVVPDVSVGFVPIKHLLNVVGCKNLSYLNVSSPSHKEGCGTKSYQCNHCVCSAPDATV
jgi:hypothetical protein